MSNDMRKRVERFRNKAKDIKWPENIVDFESSNFCVSGIKPLDEAIDEIQSAFVWCWSMKDHLKKSLYENNKNISRKEFNKCFENEINSYKELTLCADIANSEKHQGLDQKPRSGSVVTLDMSHLIKISKSTISQIHRIDGRYFFTPKSNEAVKLTANIINDKNEIVADAFNCIDKSLEAWELITSKYSGT
ncbi:hypothetical protein [Agarivorans sp. QJM3NY_33]|uniref:hypothetical protein n=1 Tax=Agarivorans sp. QJM3NY_33 TaxID=3421432 RepID=UPI003D7DE6BB